MCKLCSGVSVWNQDIIEIGGVWVVLGGFNHGADCQVQGVTMSGDWSRNVILTTRESDLNISNHVTLTPPAFISPCASVILVCERLCGLCVCECVCQFNFLFQHVIICGMEKGARKARVLSLFPFKPNQPHEIQSEDANVKKRSNIFPSWFCCSNWCFFLTLQDSTRPAFLLRW